MLDKFKDLGKLVGLGKDDEIRDLLKEFTAENFEKLRSLIAQDPEKFQEVIAYLSDKDRNVRITTATVLGKLGDLRAIDPLISALSDKARRVKQEAADSLGKLKDPEKKAVEPLIKVLKDKDSGVRMFAARALGRIGDERAATPLINTLSDKDEGVRQWGCDAIGILGIRSPEVIEPLKRLLEHRNKRIKLGAAGALGRLGDKSGFDIAMDILEGGLIKAGKFVRAEAAEVLGCIGDPRAKPLLTKVAQSRDKCVRKAAKKALERLEETSSSS
jgi:HEAT repeat protein